jgi:hypothetical protein
LFGAVEPEQVIAKATAVATALKDVLHSQKLISTISGREYPKCEAWTLLGTMLGVFPVLEWCRPIEGGWEARVQAKTKDGSIIGAAEAECLRSEKNWANRDDFALRSMAQTRATAKCLRMPLGFVMTLAGYEVTPAEEMAFDHPKTSQPPPGRSRPSQHRATPPKEAATPSAAPASSPKTVPLADENSRGRVLRQFADLDLAKEFFAKLGWILPAGETVEDLPLQYVPITKKQNDALINSFKNFEAGGELVQPYKPNPTKPAEPAKPTPAAKPKDPEWWRGILVPIPPKGVRRDDYLKAPQTVGGLYDDRHDPDTAKRLFGFIAHFEVKKTWVGDDGQERANSPGQIATDTKFREALDAAADYHEKHKNDTDQPQAAYEPAEPEDLDVPF